MVESWYDCQPISAALELVGNSNNLLRLFLPSFDISIAKIAQKNNAGILLCKKQKGQSFNQICWSRVFFNENF